MKLYDDTILEGAIDIHVHIGPDYMPRYADALTLAEEAAACGMRGLVTKCHLCNTVAASHAATQAVPGVEVFGSVTLNGTVGGLSPRTVITSVKSGAKVVWLPTVDAKYAYDKAADGHWIRHYVNGSTFGYPFELLTVTDETGALKPEVLEIMRVCKDYKVALCSGHVSPAECVALARAARDMGFAQLEITHANAWVEDFTMEVLRELADCGAWISLSYGACSPHNGRQDPEEIVDIIKTIGAGRCIMMTDYGQVNSPSPAQGLRVFYYLMKKLGISADELSLMIRANPARLLGLEDADAE